MDANKGPGLLASSFYPRKRQSDELFSCNLCHHSALKLISRRDYGAVTMSLNVLFYGKGFSLVISWLFNRRQVVMELAHSSPTTGPHSEQVQCNSNSSSLFPAHFCYPAPYPIDIVICFLGSKVDGAWQDLESVEIASLHAARVLVENIARHVFTLLILRSHVQLKFLKFALNFKSLVHYMFWPIWSSSVTSKIAADNWCTSVNV
jgi:hypothetical protein